VRQASVGSEQTKTDSLTKAENQLRKVIADKNLVTVYPASTRLLDLVRLRLHPSERMHELAHTLIAKTANDHLKQDLWDYTTLLDGVLETEGQKLADSQKADLASDELTDWLSTIQGTAASDADHAISLWTKEHSTAWLIVALSKVKGNSAHSDELGTEALKETLIKSLIRDQK
jgi:hypothetical protein